MKRIVGIQPRQYDYQDVEVKRNVGYSYKERCKKMMGHEASCTMDEQKYPYDHVE